MSNLNILIVEGNLREENQNFSEVGIQTHTESLKDSLSHFTNNLNFDVVNPSSDKNLSLVSAKLLNYDGLIWGGSSLNIYNDTPEIKRQIEFMKECQKKVKNILAICWGMQVAVTAAGGEVKKATNSHIGIANEIMLSKDGLNHPLYKDKDNKFNSPAFNFDEVVTIPSNGVCLASNKINNVHLKDRTFDAKTVEPGLGDTDFRKIFATLRDIKYGGPFILQTARSDSGKEKDTILRVSCFDRPKSTKKKTMIFIAFGIDNGFSKVVAVSYWQS